MLIAAATFEIEPSAGTGGVFFSPFDLERHFTDARSKLATRVSFSEQFSPFPSGHGRARFREERFSFGHLHNFKCKRVGGDIRFDRTR